MSRTSIGRHAATLPHGPMSYEEFLATDFENPHVEWVNGRVVEMSPSNDQHADLNGFLGALLRIFVHERQLGIVRNEFQMKTGPELGGRVPDRKS